MLMMLLMLKMFLLLLLLLLLTGGAAPLLHQKQVQQPRYCWQRRGRLGLVCDPA